MKGADRADQHEQPSEATLDEGRVANAQYLSDRYGVDTLSLSQSYAEHGSTVDLDSMVIGASRFFSEAVHMEVRERWLQENIDVMNRPETIAAGTYTATIVLEKPIGEGTNDFDWDGYVNATVANTVPVSTATFTYTCEPNASTWCELDGHPDPPEPTIDYYAEVEYSATPSSGTTASRSAAAVLREAMGARPSEMPHPHRHHILFKKGLGEAQQELVREAEAILRAHDIDPDKIENRCWAPMYAVGQHDIVALQIVVDSIKSMEYLGGVRADYVVLLTELGKIASNRR